jgi:prepilin-type N-terminal cleavage/methylation domain-containing protein
MRLGKRQDGFSLIEVMLALVLGLILTGGAISLFIANKQSYRMAEALARIQETGRYAIDAVGEDLRMAGHAGCAPRDANGAVFIEATASSISPGTFPPDPVSMEDQDSDGTVETLAISYASAAAIDLASDMSSPTADVVLEADSLVDANEDAIIVRRPRFLRLRVRRSTRPQDSRPWGTLAVTTAEAVRCSRPT